MSTELWVAASVGALCGAAVGTERQWSGHADGKDAHFGGLRTFTLLGLIGGIAGWLWETGFAVAGALLLAVLRRSSSRDMSPPARVTLTARPRWPRWSSWQRASRGIGTCSRQWDDRRRGSSSRREDATACSGASRGRSRISRGRPLRGDGACGPAAPARRTISGAGRSPATTALAISVALFRPELRGLYGTCRQRPTPGASSHAFLVGVAQPPSP